VVQPIRDPRISILNLYIIHVDPMQLISWEHHKNSNMFNINKLMKQLRKSNTKPKNKRKSAKLPNNRKSKNKRKLSKRRRLSKNKRKLSKNKIKLSKKRQLALRKMPSKQPHLPS